MVSGPSYYDQLYFELGFARILNMDWNEHENTKCFVVWLSKSFLHLFLTISL